MHVYTHITYLSTISSVSIIIGISFGRMGLVSIVVLSSAVILISIVSGWDGGDLIVLMFSIYSLVSA